MCRQVTLDQHFLMRDMEQIAYADDNGTLEWLVESAVGTVQGGTVLMSEASAEETDPSPFKLGELSAASIC